MGGQVYVSWPAEKGSSSSAATEDFARSMSSAGSTASAQDTFEQHIMRAVGNALSSASRSCRRASEMRAAATSTHARLQMRQWVPGPPGMLARSGADAKRASRVSVQMCHGAHLVPPQWDQRIWDEGYARRQSCLGDVSWRSQWSFLPQPNARAISANVCAERCSNPPCDAADGTQLRRARGGSWPDLTLMAHTRSPVPVLISSPIQ